MIVINFGHPLSNRTLEQLSTALDGEAINNIKDIKFTADFEKPFGEQASALLDGIGFSPTEWQHIPFVVVLPGLSDMGAALLAELHGRAGYWPTVVRMKRVPNANPPQFELGELLALQQVRDEARTRR